MADRFVSYNHNANCCSTCAAATSSARICRILDTAIIVAVSIFICLLNLRLRGWLM